MTRERNTLLAAAVLTRSVFRDMTFSQMPTDSRKLRNANISAHTVVFGGIIQMRATTRGYSLEEEYALWLRIFD